NFVLQCDQPIVSSGTWRMRRDARVELSNESEISGRQSGAYLQFAPGATVNVRVASSYIDAEQAQLNLKRELPETTDLESIGAAAKAAWNETLGKVRAEGGSQEQLQTFYSCMFRASLFPRKF